MGGNSALIYAHELAPRMKRKAHLRIDMDNGDVKFRGGICSVVDMGNDVVSGEKINFLADVGDNLTQKLRLVFEEEGCGVV